MGIHIIKMPDIGEGIAEVELVEWHVKVGDTIQEDQVLAEVMTDKAAVEIPSPVAGVVKVLGGTLGQMMAVGTDLITIEVEGEGNVKPGEAGAAGAMASTGPAGASAEALASSSLGGSSSVATQGQGHGQMPPASAGAGASSSGALGAGHADQQVAARAGSGAGTGAGTAQGRAAGARGGLGADRAGTGNGSASGGSASAPWDASGGRQPAGAEPAAIVPRQFGEAPLASPAVRRRAWDLGVELRFVPGSGPHGRIRHEDLEAYVKQQAGMLSGGAGLGVNAAYLPRAGTREVPVIGLRRKIAEKMQESKRRIPHFSYVEEMDVTALEALRLQLNAQHGKTRGKLSLIPFIARAMVLALRQFPQINARFDDEAGVVTRYEGVHLGVAVQTPQGLVVAVVRHAESRDLWGNAAEVARLAELARAGRANREELSGSTITLSSLGALGGIASTPVINHPEVGIIAVNRIVEKPVVHDGQIAIRKTMNLSSSFDHRVVDGMDAAAFIQAVRQLLENPAMLFID